MKVLISTSAKPASNKASTAKTVVKIKPINLKVLERKLKASSYGDLVKQEDQDGTQVLVLAQTLVSIEKAQAQQLAKDVLKELGAKSVRTKKAPNTAVLYQAELDGGLIYAGEYISYAGANEGSVGGIMLSTVLI